MLHGGKGVVIVVFFSFGVFTIDFRFVIISNIIVFIALIALVLDSVTMHLVFNV